MVKHCICCDADVEKIKNAGDGYAFFNIVQATTVMIVDDGTKTAKRQSTTYVCDDCVGTYRIDWTQLIHTTWEDEIRLGGHT